MHSHTAPEQGFDVTVFDRHRMSAMETSFANGGQLSASNAEVWNSFATVLKGIKWMMQTDAPLLVNPWPSWHKYSWMAEFVSHIPDYRASTLETVRLAIAARQLLLKHAETYGVDFNVEHRGILHFYKDAAGFAAAEKVNALYNEGGLERYAVSPAEMAKIEPSLDPSAYHGGFFTPSDFTGDMCAAPSRSLHACTAQRPGRSASKQTRLPLTHVRRNPSAATATRAASRAASRRRA